MEGDRNSLLGCCRGLAVVLHVFWYTVFSMCARLVFLGFSWMLIIPIQASWTGSKVIALRQWPRFSLCWAPPFLIPSALSQLYSTVLGWEIKRKYLLSDRERRTQTMSLISVFFLFNSIFDPWHSSRMCPNLFQLILDLTHSVHLRAASNLVYSSVKHSVHTSSVLLMQYCGIFHSHI